MPKKFYEFLRYFIHVTNTAVLTACKHLQVLQTHINFDVFLGNLENTVFPGPNARAFEDIYFF